MPSTILKSTKKWSLISLASVVLSLSSTAVYACVKHMGNLGDGSAVFFSCGSSAGNYAVSCDSNGCIIDNDPVVQAGVDEWCASPDSCLRGLEEHNQ